jgi:MoaA/NifB/PqqE/SkfB family radical SAM enzyme
MADSFCVSPFVQLHVTTRGTTGPCCLHDEPMRDAGQLVQLTTHTLAQAWRSTGMEQLRAAFLNGERPPTCARCWDAESHGFRSRRTWTNESPEFRAKPGETPGARTSLRLLSLHLGNRCNLKCRTCGPNESSFWVEEQRALGRALPRLAGHEPPPPETEWVKSFARHVDQLDELLPELQWLEFLGGEPMLIEEHFAVLRRCVETGHASHITLRYTTNGTIVPAALAELVSHFRQVSLGVSLDAIGPRFEYLRHPARWANLERNLDRLRQLPRIELSAQAVLSAYNAWHLPDLIAYLRAAKLRLVISPMGHPEDLHPGVLPPTLREEIVARLRSLTFGKQHDEALLRHNVDAMISQLQGEDRPRERARFVELTRWHDRYRGEDCATTFPELASVFRT